MQIYTSLMNSQNFTKSSKITKNMLYFLWYNPCFRTSAELSGNGEYIKYIQNTIRYILVLELILDNRLIYLKNCYFFQEHDICYNYIIIFACLMFFLFYSDDLVSLYPWNNSPENEGIIGNFKISFYVDGIRGVTNV